MFVLKYRKFFGSRPREEAVRVDIALEGSETVVISHIVPTTSEVTL